MDLGNSPIHIIHDSVLGHFSYILFQLSKRPVQTLSGGQKQRVAIAGALAEACKVLLLDELTTFLDEKDQIGVVNAVKKGITALWVTQRLEELECADAAIYLENGRVAMHGEASTVMDFIESKQAAYNQKMNS